MASRINRMVSSRDSISSQPQSDAPFDDSWRDLATGYFKRLLWLQLQCAAMSGCRMVRLGSKGYSTQPANCKTPENPAFCDATHPE